MRNVFRLAAATWLACTVACASNGTPAAKHTTVDDHPLAGLVAQHILVTPVFALAVAPELDWNHSISRRTAVLARLDSIIADTLDERGVKRHWVFPPELERSYEANPTYASDPYTLGFEPLRPSSFIAGSRLPEPLASQLRTMSALSDGRYVLAPVELRLERVGSTGTVGRAVLRLALLDSRLSEARWVGEVKSDTASSFSPALLGSLASHFADLIVAP